MKKRILINAVHPEEKRVAIVEGERLVDFYVEVSSKVHLRGNIYKGVIARIEPGIQAVFVNFGQKKQGFLQFREIKPEYHRKTAGEKKGKKGKKGRVQDLLEKGQELVVQVEKDERDTKGASLTTYLSLPGRYIVMIPGQEKIGISRKIESREDRDRLKEAFKSLKLPKKMGFILRTASSDMTEKELSQDLQYLNKLWNRIQNEAKKVSAPALIYREHDIAVRTVRDYLTSDVDEVLVDDLDAYRNTKDFLKRTVPWRKINVRLYKDVKPIFSAFGIDDQIVRLSERFIKLPSGGYLVFDKAEALTVIDVNSGRSRKEKNEEATALKTNLEAADEIARQLRLRDIGGLIVIDFIDMASPQNRKDLERRLKDGLSADKAHIDIGSVSKFGIVEMTRERMRTAYFDSVHDKCPLCSGAGIIKSGEIVALAALRDMQLRATAGGIQKIHCRMPVESANYLMNAKRRELLELEKKFGVSIILTADLSVQPGQFEIEAEAAR